MVRAIRAPKTGKTEGSRVLFPGEQSWEIWALDPSSTSLVEGNCPPGQAGSRLRTNSILALPVQEVVVVPIWLATVDRSVMEDMLWLQLEKRGLVSRSRPGEPVDFRVIARQDERSLLAVTVLRGDFPDELCVNRISDYRLSSDFLPLSGNQLFLWRELGRFVMAFSRDGELVYAQSLPPDSLFGHVVQEALCSMLALEGDGTLEAIQGVTAWGSFSQADLRELGRVFGCEAAQAPRPQPRLFERKRNLLPASVKAGHQQNEEKKRNLRMLAGAGVLYLLLLAAALGQVGWLFWKKHGLESELARNRAEVETIRQTAQRWEALEAAIMPAGYPVEILYRSTRHLPAEGVRLVTFSQEPKQVLLVGEAKSSSAAYKFLDDLKKDPELGDYAWDMPPPKLLTNDTAQFRIEGKSKYAPSHKP